MFKEEFNSSMRLCYVETNYHNDNFTYSLASEESRRGHIMHLTCLN